MPAVPSVTARAVAAAVGAAAVPAVVAARAEPAGPEVAGVAAVVRASEPVDVVAESVADSVPGRDSPEDWARVVDSAWEVGRVWAVDWVFAAVW